ncbi:MAG: hypothetical protein ABFD60_04345 [Bryobacteraceae bacterium]
MPTIPNTTGRHDIGVVTVKDVAVRDEKSNFVNIGAGKSVIDETKTLSAGDQVHMWLNVVMENGKSVAYVDSVSEGSAEPKAAAQEKPKASSTGIKLPTTVGTHNLGTVTIQGVEEANKSCNWIAIGADKSLKTWKKHNFATEPAENATGEMVIEVKETEWQGESRLEFWVKSFGGEKAKGGGGGGRGYAPKSSAEIHAPSIGGIIKSAIETGSSDWKTIAREAIAIYKEAINGIGGDK